MNGECLVFFVTSQTVMTSAIAKPLRLETLASLDLALFLSETTITMEESLTTRICVLNSLTKSDILFCVYVQTGKKALWAKVRLIPGISCT